MADKDTLMLGYTNLVCLTFDVHTSTSWICHVFSLSQASAFMQDPS